MSSAGSVTSGKAPTTELFRDNQYVYYTWGDNRDRSTNSTGVVRNQANVRELRISWPS